MNNFSNIFGFLNNVSKLMTARFWHYRPMERTKYFVSKKHPKKNNFLEYVNNGKKKH